MFLRILKKDLKRKRTMNFIIVLFVILATMFVASGLNNVITVANGTDYYLEKANIGDYIFISSGNDEDNVIKNELDSTKEIDGYRVENIVFGSQDNLSKTDGSEVTTKNTLIIQSYEGSAISFFDENNETPTDLKTGHCYVTGNFFDKNDMAAGDKIVFEMSDVKLTLIVDGSIKDALFGSDLMGNTRLVFSSEDMNTLLADESIYNYMTGKIIYIDSEDTDAVSAAASNCEGLLFSKPSSIIKTAYVMNMIVAILTLILSICLIIVAFVVLKFTITFTITEEYREIGVMKAIGISNFKIRSLYLTKYLLIAIAGSAVGLILSFPFGKLLIKSVSENMVLGNNLGVLPNILGALLVVVAIIGFAYLSTGKVKKATPVDAIRAGQTGERYTKKTALKLGKSKADAPVFMAVNDILSSPKRYSTITVAFALCTLFALVLANTVSTMKSDVLVETFASKSDLYFGSVSSHMSFMHEGGDEPLNEFLQDIEEELSERNMPGKVFVDVLYTYKVVSNGKEYAIDCQQGKGTTMDMYAYTEGSAPQSKYEIAITPQISEMIDAKIGDTVTIDYKTEKIDCVVVAYYQTMNQLGEEIRIHEDAPTTMADCSSLFAFQIAFDDNPSCEVIEERGKILEDEMGMTDVFNATEYQIDCLSVVPTMELVRNLLLAITLVVVVLVTILMERSFISDEKGEIAILKAIGFKDRRVIWWQVCRFGLVALMAVVIAGVLSIPVTNLVIPPIFGMMGASEVSCVINPLQVFLIYPGIIAAITVIVTYFTALYTKTIKSSDTASIE